jgi:nitronate monooxygenase
MSTFLQRLGLDLPIIQAPMAGAQGSALAIAVSNAGGLGSLACALLDAAGLERELTALRTGTTKPFNVNFVCHAQPVVDPAREALWRATLRPYFEELDVDIAEIVPGVGRAPFDEEAVEVLLRFEPTVVSFHFGLPAEALLQKVRSSGAKILSSATTVAEARWLEARGVDAVIAQGVEAGGHRGCFLTEEATTQLGTLALVPQIVDAVRVPVIAAGGIADARGVAAVMALGASAAQIGTAYLLCPEATTSAVHRAALKSDAATHTALTNVFTGRAARGIVNRLVRELGPFTDRVTAFPLATSALAPLRARAESRGSCDFSPLWSGQNASGCRETPAADITRELAGSLR